MVLTPDTVLYDSATLTIRRPCAQGRRLLGDSGFRKDHQLVAMSTATHAGMLINRRVYRPSQLKPAARTFVEPSPKPVVVGHDAGSLFQQVDGRAVGKIVKAEYMDTSNGRPDDFVTTKWDYKKRPPLGHVRVWQQIFDSDTIERIMDGRFNRQSIGFNARQMLDSISNVDLMTLSREDWPDHIVEGKAQVDQKLVYIIPQDMMFIHHAFTDEPADPWAGVDAFKVEPKQQTEGVGVVQFYAQDRGSGVLWDTCSADAMKNVYNPVWAVSIDLARPPAAQNISGTDLEEDQQQRLIDKLVEQSGAILTDSDYESALSILSLMDGESYCKTLGGAPKSPSEALMSLLLSKDNQQRVEELLHEISDKFSDHVRSYIHGRNLVVFLKEDPSSHVRVPYSSEIFANFSEQTPLLDKQDEAKSLDSKTEGKDDSKETVAMEDLIKELSKLTDQQISELEPISKILENWKTQLEKSKDAAVKEATDAAKEQLELATKTIEELQGQIKEDLVDRVFDAFSKLGRYPEEDLKDEEKVKQHREKLAQRSIESLHDSLCDIAPLVDSLTSNRDTGTGDTIDGRAVPPNTGVNKKADASNSRIPDKFRLAARLIG